MESVINIGGLEQKIFEQYQKNISEKYEKSITILNKEFFNQFSNLNNDTIKIIIQIQILIGWIRPDDISNITEYWKIADPEIKQTFIRHLFIRFQDVYFVYFLLQERGLAPEFLHKNVLQDIIQMILYINLLINNVKKNIMKLKYANDILEFLPIFQSKLENIKSTDTYLTDIEVKNKLNNLNSSETIFKKASLIESISYIANIPLDKYLLAIKLCSYIDYLSYSFGFTSVNIKDYIILLKNIDELQIKLIENEQVADYSMQQAIEILNSHRDLKYKLNSDKYESILS